MKKILPAILAIVFAAGLSAYTEVSQTGTDQIWFTLKENGNPSNPLDYFPTPGNERICFETGDVCGVKAREGQPGHPDLSDPQLQYQEMATR